jgi:predicted NACHT family NTPase
LSRLYIDLETHLEPISASEERRNKKISVKSLFENLDSHLILLGRPGSGKTTTIKSICQDLIGGDSRFKGFFPVPIVVRLREVESTASLFDMILELLDIPIVATINSREDKRMVDALDGLGTPEPLRGIDKRIKQNIVLNILNENRVLVVFDGFDEIVSSSVSHRGGKLASKDMFVADFKALCLGVDSSLLILTSRTADFPYYITGAAKYEISRLSNRQIKKYINNFFTDKTEAQRARASIANKKLLGSEGIPLTLAYLCIIY